MQDDADIPDDVKTLGDAIRWLREKRGLTLRALARETGFAPAFVSDLEHNRRSTEQLQTFAKALDCDVGLLARFDKRLTRELEDWLSENPAVAPLLRQLRATERPVERLQRALKNDE